jgi:hypothetical protein
MKDRILENIWNRAAERKENYNQKEKFSEKRTDRTEKVMK